MRTTLLATAFAVVLGACSGANDPGPTGGFSVTAAALALPGDVQQVTITANPGGFTATLSHDPATGEFRGSMILPVGAYTVDVAAFGDRDGDGIPELIGTGSTSVVVFENQTTSALVRIVDVTGPLPVPDHGPLITSVSVSGASAGVNVPLTLAASAVDVDGDALSFAWSATCDSGLPGTFSAPDSATTDWTPAAVGLCTIRLDVTAKGLADAASFEIPVYQPGEGILQVVARFVTYATIDGMAFSGTDARGVPFASTVLRTGPSATLPSDVAPGAGVYVSLWTREPADALSIADGCGGSFSTYFMTPTSLEGMWFAPPAPAVCVVTGRALRDGLADTLPVAVNVGDPLVAGLSIVPRTGQVTWLDTGDPAPGFLPRFGRLLQLDADTRQGTLVTDARVSPFSWAEQGNDVVLFFSSPRTSAVECPSIRESPAPLDVQDAYIATYGEFICVPVDLVRTRITPVARRGAGFQTVEADTYLTTWAFDLGGVPHVYTSERDLTDRWALRPFTTTDTWTPDLAAGTWATGTFYSAGIGYIDELPLPMAFNGDLLTLHPQGTGTARFSGRTFLWTAGGPELRLLFADGSMQTVRIVDVDADVFGLWSEHRDASGALVAGVYDWAIRMPEVAPAVVRDFVTGDLEYWQTFVNAWQLQFWAAPDALVFEAQFGWQLLADGTGSNFSAFYDVGPNGEQVPVLERFPLTWFLTPEGLVQLDRFQFPTGENRGFRQWTPLRMSADGRRAYVIEHDLRRRDPLGPYQVLIAPRLNLYERRANPYFPF